MTALILDDGLRTLDLISESGEGVWATGWNPPILGRENTYAEGADSDGRRRVRTRNQNGEGGLSVAFGSSVGEANFWDYVDDFQEMVESVHSNKGSLRYEPPRNGEPVTYDIESIRLSGFPQKGVLLNQLVAEAEAEFECLPYGRLDPVTVWTGQLLNGPIDFIDIDTIPAHLRAWCELTLSDASGQTRSHVELGIQEDYAPSSPEPLLLNLASGLTVTAFAGSSATRTGSYSANVARATLTGSPVTVCATTAQPHKDRWKPRARVYASGVGARVRLTWKVGDGPLTSERWVDVPAASNFFDLDLQTIAIEELPIDHSWTGYIDAYSTSGSPTLDVDFLVTVPA